MKAKMLTTLAFAAMSCFGQNQKPVNGKFSLLELPYKTDALQPYISQQTMELHWGKHVQTYVDNTNKLVAGSGLENLPLDELVKKAPKGPLYNNAAQIWNHNFFFASLSPKPQTEPKGELLKLMNSDFGSFENFIEEFKKAGVGVFGSGWVWLVKNKDGHLEILQTPNGDCIIFDPAGYRPLLNCDVWEHAYYLDYKNKRADYLAAFFHVIDWKVVEKRL